MLGRGHKRSRSHFSEFTIVPQSPRPVEGDRKQQSEESQAAKIQARRSLGHKKSFSTTSLIAIAGTVVTTDALDKYPDLVFSPSNSVAMARPRSPQKKHDAEYDKMELMLDKKLLAIREQLVSFAHVLVNASIVLLYDSDVGECVYCSHFIQVVAILYSTELCKSLVQ